MSDKHQATRYRLNKHKSEYNDVFGFRFNNDLMQQLQGCTSLVVSHHKGTKKREELSFFSSVPPQGLDCTTAVGSRVLNIDIPPKSPFGKGGLRQGSRPRHINKKSDGKTIGLLVVPPQGVA